MKVYQINVVCGSGSTGRIVADLSRVIQSTGGECRIAYGRGDAPADVDAIKISNKLDLYWHAMMTRLTDRHGLYSKAATGNLIKDIIQYGPDIIHLHNIHGYYVNYEMLFKFLKEYGKPVVWTLHDCWAFTGHCAHFDAVGCVKWKRGCEYCRQRSAYPASYVRDASKENYLRKLNAFTEVNKLQIVTVSNWLKQMGKNSFLAKYRMTTIYNGIDLEVMKPTDSDLKQRYGVTQKRVVLGVASVWNEKKGLDIFRKIAGRLSEDYQIVMIGVEKQQKQGLPKNILCLEKQEYTELVKWYSLADVYVNGSIEETMGMTTLEAMACGTPVVVQNATAVPEMVGEGCGVMVEKNDVEGMIQAITNVKKTEEVSKQCIEWAAGFEKKLQYNKYYDLYQSMIL